MTDRTRATLILSQAAEGDDAAASRLLPLVYDELRTLADGYFRGQQGGHTLEPTALVHEAFIKLIGQSDADWKSRAHFIAVAAMAMRQLLVDHARSRAAAKHGAEWRRVSLDDAVLGRQTDADLDLLALHEAMTELARLDPRQSRVVELRFFGGMTAKETAGVLGVSKTTVDNDWRAARAWLNARICTERGRDT